MPLSYNKKHPQFKQLLFDPLDLVYKHDPSELIQSSHDCHKGFHREIKAIIFLQYGLKIILITNQAKIKYIETS